MQGTQNVTLGYLRLSGEFKYNLWEFGELRPRRSSSGFLYDMKHPSGHRGRLPLGERLGYEPTRGNVGFRYCDQK